MKVMRVLLLGLLAAVPLAWAPPAAAQLRIAAVVNDEAISFLDLDARIHLVLISANLQPTPENRNRAAAQVLRQLVDERLQLQEAKRLNVTATEQDIQDAFRRIEQQGSMPPGGIEDELRKAGIRRDSLVDQIRAAVVWQKLVRRQLAPQVQVGDEEVQEILENIKRSADLPELRVVEILLGIDRPEREGEVRRFAEGLIEQAKGGADFSGLASQFSEAASASMGGDVGWVLPNQLDDAVEKELARANPGDIVGPIRTVAGYQIVRLLERRVMKAADPDQAVVNLRQALFPPTAGSMAERQQLAATVSSATTCPDFEKLAEENKAARPFTLGRLKIGDLNPTLKPVVAPLGAGKISAPITAGDILVVFMVCDRVEPESSLPKAEDVREQIFRGKLGIVSRRYLRDLRRAAYLDFRS